MTACLPTIGSAAALALAVTCAHGQDAGVLPPYAPDRIVSATVRVWSSDSMRSIVDRWRKGFQLHHPDAGIAANASGTDVAMAGLYTGQADVALMGREPTASEIQAFEWIFRYRPTRLVIMNGSLDAAGKSPALAVFVHEENPLSKLTLAQLDAVFGREHRGGAQNIDTWGQLDVGGDWAARRINLYGYDAESGTGRFFRSVVLGGSRNMNWDRLHEFAEAKSSDSAHTDAGWRILDALVEDPLGMAVSSPGPARTTLKLLTLAAVAGGRYVEATRDNIMSGQYPLARVVFALVNRAPGRPADPAVRELARYILSRDGQADIALEGAFLPLRPDVVRAQLHELD